MKMDSPIKPYVRLFLVVVTSLVVASLHAASETKKDGSAAPQTQQKQFKTPKEAADSLVQAADSHDVAALKEILGPDSADIVASEDPVGDKNRATAFAAKAKEKSSIGIDSKNPSRAILTVGNDNFP